MSVLFDRSVLARDPVRRQRLVEVLAAGIDAVEPGKAVHRALVRSGNLLEIAGRRFDLADYDSVRVIGLGKASVAMATAVGEVLGDVPLSGVVVAPSAGVVPHLRVVVGSHPVPDRNSVSSAGELLRAARVVTGRQLLVVVISGGGSALATLPAADVTIDDLRSLTDALLRSGADIRELNTVRKHVDGIKGGRLLEAAAAARTVITLVMSDVVGNPLDMIASGPTVPDPTTFRDALNIIERYDLGDVSAAVTRHIEKGVAGEVPETPAAGVVFARQTVAIVADAAAAARGAIDAATRAGIPAEVVTTSLTGEARLVGGRIVAAAPQQDGMAIYAGETTVTVVGEGRGGRNQELALAAAIELVGTEDLLVASVGTDGRDGPTDAAGGVADGGTVARSAVAGLDAHRALANNDAYPLLEASGDLLRTGPTGTNVGDLVVVYRCAKR